MEVPESVQALIAARLDTLPGEERRVVQDASVIGQSFTRQTLAALSGLDDAEVDPMLTTLVRKELLEIQADPRSPERGQYRFVHAMVRTVAYGTLARRDRKARHLAVAGYLEQIMEGDELAPIVVGHLLAAAQAVPSDPDVPSLRTAARDHLVRAARRAARLAAVDEAQRYFERALELSTDPADRAQMAYEAGMMAVRSAHASEALAHFAEAREIHADKGDLDALTSVATAQAWALVELGELEEAYRVAMDAAAALEPAPPTAELAAIIGRICFRTTRHTEALEWFERGLAVAERSEAWDALASALTGRGTALRIGPWAVRLSAASC